MLSKRTDNNRNQLEMVALDQLVPEDHLVRKIEQAIDFDFIYDLVKDTYCLDNGRPSIDPVVLIKMVFVQYLFGIRSMRQTTYPRKCRPLRSRRGRRNAYRAP